MKKNSSWDSVGAAFAILFVLFIVIPVSISMLYGTYKLQKKKAVEEQFWNDINAITAGDGHKGGTRYVCYDEKNHTYTDEYCFWDMEKLIDESFTVSADDVGAILYYSSEMKEDVFYYGENYNPVSARKEVWQVEVLQVRLVDRSDGKILGTNTFTAIPPQQKDSEREQIALVSTFDIMPWVGDIWSGYARSDSN